METLSSEHRGAVKRPIAVAWKSPLATAPARQAEPSALSMNDSAPLVSICMPCHNAARHLPQALESIFAQTYRNIEVVAVNDSSNDGTGEILDAAARSQRLTAIHASAGSAAKSRNLAFSRARGGFIKYFDADDVLSPDLVERQVERLVDQRDCIASSRWKRFHGLLDEQEFAPDGTWTDRDAVDWLVESQREGGIHAMMQCGMFLIPRELIERAGGWDERLTLIDDTEFFGRLFCGARRILHTDGALYYRSGLEGSLSGQKSRKAYESAVLSVEGFCRSLVGREDSERTRRTAADLCQAYHFEIAPFEPDLGARLRGLADQFGGSRLRPIGGPMFRMLARVIGWPAASRLRSRAKTLGYASLRRRLGQLRPNHPRPLKACAQR
jgi:glycosyltransferase involved in cell wall biosynthesis